jgi:hypothetical protein
VACRGEFRELLAAAAGAGARAFGRQGSDDGQSDAPLLASVTTATLRTGSDPQLTAAVQEGLLAQPGQRRVGDLAPARIDRRRGCVNHSTAEAGRHNYGGASRWLRSNPMHPAACHRKGNRDEQRSRSDGRSVIHTVNLTIWTAGHRLGSLLDIEE